MAEYTKEEALAFVDATRLTIKGKAGFRWMGDKLSDLSAFIESMGEENEQLNDYIDESGKRDEYEAYRISHAADDNTSEGDS